MAGTNGGAVRTRDGSSNNRRIKRELKVCRACICVKRRKGRVIRRRDIEATAAANEKRAAGVARGKQAERVHPRRLHVTLHSLARARARAPFLSLRIEPSRLRRRMIYLAFRPIGSSAEIITGSFRRVVIFRRNSFNSANPERNKFRCGRLFVYVCRCVCVCVPLCAPTAGGIYLLLQVDLLLVHWTTNRPSLGDQNTAGFRRKRQPAEPPRKIRVAIYRERNLQTNGGKLTLKCSATIPFGRPKELFKASCDSNIFQLSPFVLPAIPSVTLLARPTQKIIKDHENIFVPESREARMA